MRTNALLGVDHFTFNHLFNFENPYLGKSKVSGSLGQFRTKRNAKASGFI